jgi:RNA polymerase-binding transcription factor DksA
MKNHTAEFKDKLEQERELLKRELGDIGTIKNSQSPDDWQAKHDDMDILRADANEVADQIGSYENNTALVNELEQRLMDINQALEKMEKGTFGICEVCNKPIEDDRLGANPAAKTCKQHMNS